MRKKQLVQIVEKMREYIGSTPCTCVESQEARDYQALINTGSDPFERLMLAIAHEGPKVEDLLVEECVRCQLIMEYEELFGISYEYEVTDPVSDEDKLAVSEQLLKSLANYRDRKAGRK
jgi:hypothetical protein